MVNVQRTVKMLLGKHTGKFVTLFRSNSFNKRYSRQITEG